MLEKLRKPGTARDIALKAFAKEKGTLGKSAKEWAPDLFDSGSHGEAIAYMRNLEAGKQVTADHKPGMLRWRADDGTVIRIKEEGFYGTPELTVEVQKIPGDNMNANKIAFKVDGQGRPIPHQVNKIPNRFPDDPMKQEFYENAVSDSSHKRW